MAKSNSLYRPRTEWLQLLREASVDVDSPNPHGANEGPIAARSDAYVETYAKTILGID